VKFAPDPSIVIQLGVEEPPIVMIVASTEEAQDRVTYWVRSQPELVDLVQLALDLRNEARSA
jgi:hypothetical protein